MRWSYEKIDEEYRLRHCPMNDTDGAITGKIVINLPAWFDENPEERIRLGWIKHISYTNDEIKEKVQYDPQTQYLIKSTRAIDEYTVEDDYHVIDKSEEMMLFEDLATLYWEGSVTFVNPDGTTIVF